MKEVKKASFNFKDFTVPSFSYNESKEAELKLSFNPKGEFLKKNNLFILHLNFQALAETTRENVINVNAVATFQFSEDIEFKDIPDYFYNNSIPILYPFLRAFVSNLTLQANTGVIILDLLNLSALKDTLIKNTKEV